MTSSIYAGKKRTIVAVDIGNTSTHLALVSGGVVKKEFRVATQSLKTQNIARLIPKNFIAQAETVVIASVVPPAGIFLKKEIQKKTGLRSLLAGQDFKIPIVNRYKNPRQVGVDRLLNALAAYALAKKEAIVIDFGTAITFDVVSRRGEYLGGVIAPGIEISIDALAQRTALLPKIHLEHPKHFIGRDTVESIRVGCSVGIGGLCDRMIEAISKEQRFSPRVIATGGYATFISKYCNKIQEIDPSLIMKGIFLAYQKA